MKKNEPLKLATDRTALIERAFAANDGACSTGAINQLGETMTEAKKPLYEPGTRVCIMDEPKDPFTDYRGYRGRCGYVRCSRAISVPVGVNSDDTFVYLVTDCMPSGAGVGDWWAVVAQRDLAKV